MRSHRRTPTQTSGEIGSRRAGGVNCGGAINGCYAAEMSGRRNAQAVLSEQPDRRYGQLASRPVMQPVQFMQSVCGGLVGQNMSAIVTSYSVSAMSGRTVLRLVEKIYLGASFSYWDVQASV